MGELTYKEEDSGIRRSLYYAGGGGIAGAAASGIASVSEGIIGIRDSIATSLGEPVANFVLLAAFAIILGVPMILLHRYGHKIF